MCHCEEAVRPTKQSLLSRCFPPEADPPSAGATFAMTLSRKGWTLIELLAATLIFCLAMAAVYKIFFNGIRLSHKIKQSLRGEEESFYFFSQVEKDLKNSVCYTSTPFRADNFKLSFASLDNQISGVQYTYESGKIFKRKKVLDNADQQKTEPSANVVAENIRDFSIHYAYLDEKGNIVFNFGKHTGKSAEDVFRTEPSYYSWMMNGEFSLHTKKIITEIFQKTKAKLPS